MAQVFIETLSFVASSSTGIALAQTLGAAGNLSLNGGLVTGGVGILDAARRILLTSVGSDAAKTITVLGTDRWNNLQSETLLGASSGTAQTLKDFKTVTRISVNAAVGSNISAGTSGVGSGAWHVLDRNVTPHNTSLAVVVTPTQSSTIEYTYDDPMKLLPATSADPPNTFTLMTGIATTSDTSLNHPVQAIRLTINSGTGSAAFYGVQAGLTQAR